jgi:hypothetical protein
MLKVLCSRFYAQSLKVKAEAEERGLEIDFKREYRTQNSEFRIEKISWIPAFAGMTDSEAFRLSALSIELSGFHSFEH